MFTGIVRGTAPVATVERSDGWQTIAICLGDDLLESLEIGASVAVDGVCLTATRIEEPFVHFDVILSTLSRTTLHSLQVGQLLNIERSRHSDSEIGGHDVSGHIDCVATLTEITTPPGNRCLRFHLSPHWMRYIFPHSFVAINGVSLTVGDIDKNRSLFDTWLIPETIRRTNLGQLAIGDAANIEIHRGVQVLVDSVTDAVNHFFAKTLETGEIPSPQTESISQLMRLLGRSNTLG